MASQENINKVKELSKKIKEAKSIVLVDYKGVKVKEETELRKSIRESGSEYFIAKNRLFKLALKDAGIDESFDDILSGPTSFAIGYDDVVAPAKVIYEFGKNKKGFVIKGGCLDGSKLGADEVERLAKLPSKDELLSMTLNAMLGPVRKVVYAINAIHDKKLEGEASPSEA